MPDKQLPEQPTVIIVGGGLVGALNACFFAKRGWNVHVYEFREDPRTQGFVHGRSINLAASCRGRSALAAVGLEEIVLKNGIPMYSRYIHNKDGQTSFTVPYGKKNQFILSINRRLLNELMLSEAESHGKVQIWFQHKLIRLDVKRKELVVRRLSDHQEIRVRGDLILGCDGAFSAVRTSLLSYPLFHYSQEYIEHGYLEILMPPTKDKDFTMPPNHLHLWPRGSLTITGLANTDKTFTLTVFAPFSVFDQLTDDRKVLAYVRDQFPDLPKLIDEKTILEAFRTVRPSTLVSVKCSPHHFDNSVLLMGDAAHAMVPFYGQGMNCGFEDCLLLHEMLNKHHDNIGKALEEYSEIRVPDAQACCDLAMYNYKELRYLVYSPTFLIRKKLDSFLHFLFPNLWIPLYTTVSFTRMRYHMAVKNREWQDKVIKRILNSLVVCFGAGLITFAYCKRMRINLG